MQAEENEMLETIDNINLKTGGFDSVRRVLNSSTCALDYKVSGGAAVRSASVCALKPRMAALIWTSPC